MAVACVCRLSIPCHILTLDNSIIKDTIVFCQVKKTQMCQYKYMKKIESVYQIFIERLKDLMQDKNINMKILSTKTSIPRSTINSWNLKERLPSAECLFALAEYFDVTIDYLLGRED